VISPKIITMPVLQHVSQATRLLSSPAMQASRTASETWSQNLSVVGVVADQESRASWASCTIIRHCISEQRHRKQNRQLVSTLFCTIFVYNIHCCIRVVSHISCWILSTFSPFNQTRPFKESGSGPYSIISFPFLSPFFYSTLFLLEQRKQNFHPPDNHQTLQEDHTSTCLL
jgi:hypothetical protein